jgi:hypothetical protein
MKRALAGCLALLILSAGVAHAVSDTTKQAAAIFNKALNETLQRPVCNVTPQTTTLTHDAPSQDLLSTLAILRRPATTADVVPSQALTLGFVKDIFVDYVRVAHAVDGRSYDIVPTVDTSGAPVESDACVQAVHEDLLHRLKGKGHRVRRIALGLFKGFVDFNRQIASQPPTEAVIVFQHVARGLGSGGLAGSAQDIRRGGGFGAFETRGGSVVNCLVPDPVASVTSYFPRFGHRPAANRTDPVQDNMVSFTIRRDVRHSFRVKMVWRAADGSIVRVVRHPG